MDRNLPDWARRIKARRDRALGGAGRRLPALWLVTDERLADPCACLRALPAGPAARHLCGVLVRARTQAATRHLVRRLAPICRARGIAMLVSSSARRPALGDGRHLPARDARRGGRRRGLVSAAVHDAAELHAAVRAGARLCFISPVFATASHPRTRPLGTIRFARLAYAARRAGLVAIALGGLDAARARSLGGTLAGGAAAVSALGRGRSGGGR